MLAIGGDGQMKRRNFEGVGKIKKIPYQYDEN